ncbi:MAG: GNAT family N-acetyltransferase [Candidatus Shapirobacteria bacterium]
MIIRNVTPADYESLKIIKPSLDLETVTNRLNRQNKGEVEFLVLEDNFELVSFVLLKWNGKETHPEYPDMEDLYTKEDKRGKGYGSLLIKECERKAKKKGFSKIGLAVNPQENDHANQLYQHLGYQPTGEKTYVDGIYSGVEDWCIDMEKLIK